MLGRSRVGRGGGGQDSQTAVVRGPFIPFRKFLCAFCCQGKLPNWPNGVNANTSPE